MPSKRQLSVDVLSQPQQAAIMHLVAGRSVTSTITANAS